MRTIPWLLLAVLTGCSTPAQYSFDVSVKNNTARPLTIGFTKNGPPAEPGWASPESETNLPPDRQHATWGNVVAPAKIASIHIDGKFYGGVYPFLRIYSGEHTLTELLAMSRGNGDRLDLNLRPGPDNFFIVTEEAGRLSAKLARMASKP